MKLYNIILTYSIHNNYRISSFILKHVLQQVSKKINNLRKTFANIREIATLEKRL